MYCCGFDCGATCVLLRLFNCLLSFACGMVGCCDVLVLMAVFGSGWSGGFLVLVCGFVAGCGFDA